MRFLDWRLRELARRSPDGAAWADRDGRLTWRELDRAVQATVDALGPGPVRATGQRGRDPWIAALAGIRARRGVVLASRTLGAEAVAALADADAPDGAVVVTTSGTTGPVKRVVRRAGPSPALQLLALASRLPVRRVRSVATLAPVDRGHGFQTACLALAAGARIVDLTRLAPDEALALLRREPADLLTGLPIHLGRLVDGAEAGAGAGAGRASVRHVVAGSEPLPPDLIGRLADRLGAQVWSCYGSTETGTVTVATPADLAAHPMTVGRPIPCVRIRCEQGILAIRSPMGGRRWHRLDTGHVDAAGRVFVTGRIPPTA